MNEYVRKLQRDQDREFSNHQQRIRLEEIFSQNNGDLSAIEKEYSLRQRDKDMLEEIKAESDLQKLHDEAFLRGFNQGRK